jgi:hypothetical protein
MTALLAAALLTMTFPPAAAADDDPPGRVARLNYVQGSVSFEPAGESEWVEAVTNRPVTTGDMFWTDNGARAELHTGSATIRLDSNTGFSFLNLDDSTVQIQLTEGTLDIRVERLGRDEIFEVDTPNQAFSILRPGRYRIQASEDGNTTIVTVRAGEGEATGGGQTYSVQTGETGTFTGTDSLDGYVESAGNNDAFDNWGQGRDRRDDQSQSARYVSRDIVGYQDLDDYGSWRSDPNYGNVWTPTRVSADWAPYRNGHWAWISPWGWTWVDDAPWGYAPFHYGRWVSLNGNWGWVPGPRDVQPVYAPALVVFIGAPQFGNGYGGNVGWFPLGPREVYVPSYNVSRGYVDRVNVSNTIVTTTTITTVYNNQVANRGNNPNLYANRTVRGGVTAVPQNAFASAQPVAKAAVVLNPQQIAAAPVISRAAVAPTRTSVLGGSGASAARVAQPPAAIANRPVVAKTPPPPPPVAFAKQQQALAAHPGQPLARTEVETLRPANVVVAHPLVKQAPPGKPATPSATHPASQPVVGNSRPANAQTSNTPANGTANVPPGQVLVKPAPPGKPATLDTSHPVSRPVVNNTRPVNAQTSNAPAKPATLETSHPISQPAVNNSRPANVQTSNPPPKPAQPVKTQAVQPAKAQTSTPPLTAAEKAREEQKKRDEKKKQADKPPPPQ